jgi:hypothetical protein
LKRTLWPPAPSGSQYRSTAEAGISTAVGIDYARAPR